MQLRNSQDGSQYLCVCVFDIITANREWAKLHRHKYLMVFDRHVPRATNKANSCGLLVFFPQMAEHYPQNLG